MPADVATSSPLRLVPRSTANDPVDPALRDRDIATRWEVDLIPAAITIGDSPNGRPTVAMVAAGDLVLYVDVIARSPSEPAAIAELLLQTLGRARAATGRAPRSLIVRHTALIPHLQAGLARPGPTVSASPTLPAVDRAMEQLERDMFGLAPNSGVPRLSRPGTWSAWEAPPELVASLFSAAAGFFRAAPWLALANEDILTMRLQSGRVWSVVVMGLAQEAYGVALYESADDLCDLLEADDDSPERALAWTRGAVISFLFDDRRSLSPRSLREVRANDWEIAGPLAYPLVIPINTPGGGLSQAHILDLTDILGAIPHFVAAHRNPWDERRRTITAIEWTDDQSKATITYDGPWAPGLDLWPQPTALAPCLPRGPGARPGARYEPGAELEEELEKQGQIVAEFEQWLQRPGAAGRVSAATARKHARVARVLSDYLVTMVAIPLAAITEMHLRTFVYLSYPSKFDETETLARSMLGSLDRFFTFLSAEKGIETSWCDPILDDRAAFRERWESCPDDLASEVDVQAWVAEFFVDLEERVLVPPSSVPDLERAAQHWLQWRDEEIAAGVVDPDEVRRRLVARAGTDCHP